MSEEIHASRTRMSFWGNVLTEESSCMLCHSEDASPKNLMGFSGDPPAFRSRSKGVRWRLSPSARAPQDDVLLLRHSEDYLWGIPPALVMSFWGRSPKNPIGFLKGSFACGSGWHQIHWPFQLSSPFTLHSSLIRPLTRICKFAFAH